MANIGQVKQNVEAQDHPVKIVIYQPDGEPYTYIPKGPDGQPLERDTKGEPVSKPCTISVLGSESKKHKATERMITRRTQRMKKPFLDPADHERNRIDQAAGDVTEFEGWEDEGKLIDFTEENVKLLLGVEHILVQVERGIYAHANFSKDSSQN